jgi:hypothetical protein
VFWSSSASVEGRPADRARHRRGDGHPPSARLLAGHPQYPGGPAHRIAPPEPARDAAASIRADGAEPPPYRLTPRPVATGPWTGCSSPPRDSAGRLSGRPTAHSRQFSLCLTGDPLLSMVSGNDVTKICFRTSQYSILYNHNNKLYKCNDYYRVCRFSVHGNARGFRDVYI